MTIRRATLLVTGSFVLGIGVAAAASGAAETQGPLNIEPNNVTGADDGPHGYGFDPVPTTLMRNSGRSPIVFRRVRALWDTANGRSRGNIAGSFAIGHDAPLTWGEGGDWPPSQFTSKQRRWIPGGSLEPHERGQVWVAVRLPRRGTEHLVGFRISYRVRGHLFVAHAPVDYWYCPDQIRRECDAQIQASQP